MKETIRFFNEHFLNLYPNINFEHFYSINIIKNNISFQGDNLERFYNFDFKLKHIDETNIYKEHEIYLLGITISLISVIEKNKTYTNNI